MEGLCACVATTFIGKSGRQLLERYSCEREPRNAKDGYAVAVKKDRTVIGHLPRKVSRVCSLFLRRGGSIHCTVTGRQRYSVDLPQGGLEIPVLLTVTLFVVNLFSCDKFSLFGTATKFF